MYCNKCGNNVADGLKYCDVCGAELSNPATSTGSYDNATISSEDPGKTTGLLSMIFGIASIVLNCSCCLSFIPIIGNIISMLSFLALPSSIAGLITGIIGNKKSNSVGISNGQAKAGIITSIIGIVLGIITAIIGIAVLAYLGIFGFAMMSEM